MSITKTTPKTSRVGQFLRIAGCDCLLRSNSVQVCRTLRRWTTAHSSGAQADFDLEVLVDPELRRLPVVPSFRGLRQFVFIAFHGSDRFFFDLLRRRLVALVSQETAADESFWNSVMIPIAIGVLGPAMQVAPLHSACVSLEGRGMMVAGVSGAGKSTLAVALAQAGMDLISDDWVYAGVSGETVRIHGLGVPVKLMPDTVNFFDELSKESLKRSMNGELAFEVDPKKRFGVSVAELCEPECIVFLQRHSGGSELIPLDRQIARDFYLCSAEPLPPELFVADESRRSIIEQVVARDCWLFRNDGTPQAGAATLKQFLQERYCADIKRASAS